MRLRLTAIAIMAGLLPAAAHAAPASAPNLCRAGEQVVYACTFGRNVGSICLGKRDISYRFGRPGRVAMSIVSAPDWRNVHVGGNRSQGGLNQDHIRFTQGETHYVVHAGETGVLNERPGRRISGIVVLRGSSFPTEIANLNCPSASQLRIDLIEGRAPDELRDGPFDMIY